MGQCVGKQDISVPSKNKNKKRDRPQPAPSVERQSYITVHHGFTNSIKLDHTPLQTSPFLSNKFSNDPSRPQQVNLTFMVQSVDIDRDANQIRIRVINQKQINIYCLLDGEQQVNSTGLTVQIQGVKYVQKINRKNASEPSGDRLLVVPSRMREQKVFVILQPVLKNGQSMFFIHQYVCDPQDKKYKCHSKSLQWSSLAFGLKQIYGSDDVFKVGSNQQCSICLSNPANIILTPCRHMCICQGCAQSFKKSSNKCPICRVQFVSFIGYQ